MQHIKRFLSLALALVLVLSCVPASVIAAAAEAVSTSPALPTASVTEVNNDELTFAMNFKTNTITEEQLAYYGNWYADFELTFNKKVVLNNDGSADGWLAGQYDAYSENWVTVPFGKFAPVTVEAGETVKIMAFAAELMGEPGLKYTYKEVYETVKNFDCGVYLDDEFLLANPDLEITLELKMYNPANESESYVIGKTYNYTNPIVAVNTTTNKTYATVVDAMMDCGAGQTVALLKNVTESVVSVFDDATLDLNGYTLTAAYVSSFGTIIDSSDANTGLLVVAKNRFMVQQDNAQLPIYDGTGYRFAEVLGFNKAMYNGSFVFQPLVEANALEWLKAGKATTGVTIQVLVTWTTKDGVGTQHFVYNDQLLLDFLDSYNSSTGRYGNMFTLALSGTESITNLT